jgi:adenylate kinase family enzyme
MHRIIFTGIPGSGKGTQSELLSVYDIQQISTGEIIRAAFKNNDPVISKYRDHIEDGGFLPDEGIFNLIKKHIPTKGNGYILDGAVRTLNQAQFVDNNDLADTVIYFHLTKSLDEERLLSRGQGRADDTAGAIKKRFSIYESQTISAENYLRGNFPFYEIDASATIEEVHSQVKKALEI